MSGHYNALFRNYTKGFMQQHTMTAAGIGGLAAGNGIFDLHHHMVGGSQVVRLAQWSAHSNEVPINGYWVPQGSSCLVPVTAAGRQYVFTPDFSGCSIIVDQVAPTQYRVYHVQGGAGYLAAEYTGGGHAHGLGMAAAMTFEDYGDVTHPQGFALLKYENGRWWIYYQGQSGTMFNYNAGTQVLHAVGVAAGVRGGATMPVADLTMEIPRSGNKHGGVHLGVAINKAVQRRMLPSDDIW